MTASLGLGSYLRGVLFVDDRAVTVAAHPPSLVRHRRFPNSTAMTEAVYLPGRAASSSGGGQPGHGERCASKTRALPNANSGVVAAFRDLPPTNRAKNKSNAHAQL
jgi:hypothetical protein